jgi:hypothetical protein
MELIGWVCCEKYRRHFVARTFALIALVQPVLHQVSSSYETIPNASKHYATHQNMSLGSNRVDWVRSLRKIQTWLQGTNFCINCSSSHCFVPSFMQLRNDPKWTQTLCNSPKHEFRVQWSGLDAFIPKNPDVTSWLPIFHRVSCSYETIPNAPKHYATVKNMSLGSNGVDWVRSLRKIPTWLHGTNFCINYTSSPCFASSFMQLRNDPKCIPTLFSAPKHEFRVQWGGLGAFVIKNPDMTSWHELLH